jgi:hypothetical protein
MSKIKPKDLQYDSSLPPFLQRLKAGRSEGDGRHERAIARPKRARNPEEEEEDEPTYVDESGVNLGEGELWSLGVKKGAPSKLASDGEGEGPGEGKEGDAQKEEKDGDEEQAREREKLASIGAARKKRTGKVIGGEGDEKEREDSAAIKSLKDAINAQDNKQNGIGGAKTGADGGAKSKATKKKAKKIKLSFGDDE